MAAAAASLPVAPSLAELAADEALAVFLDFDGTLVDIADRPDAIEVPGSLVDALNTAAKWLGGRLAVVSGRPIGELTGYLGRGLALAGSHGEEIVSAEGVALAPPTSGISQFAGRAIRDFALRNEGILLEQKHLGLALHYRAHPHLEPAVKEFADRLVRSECISIKRGKCVIEFVVPGTSKAKAVDRFMTTASFAGARPIFIGDDETDEDGFAAATAHGGWGIAVGDRPSRNATFQLETPAAVRDWIGRGR